MKTSTRLACLLLPLGLAASLGAQTAADSDSRGPRRGGPGGPGGHRPNPVIRVLDTDRNHEISGSEITAAPSTLRTLDTDADGTVSAAELRPARPADAPARPAPPADAPTRPEHARPVDPVMLALDANADGSLSPAELVNAAVSLTALDADKDGKLSADEFRPLPPEGAPAAGSGPRSGSGSDRGPRPSRG